MIEFRNQQFSLGLRLLAAANVDHRCERHYALRSLERTEPDLHRNLRPILASGPQTSPEAHASRGRTGEIGSLQLRVAAFGLRRHNGLDFLPDQFLPAV